MFRQRILFYSSMIISFWSFCSCWLGGHALLLNGSARSLSTPRRSLHRPSMSLTTTTCHYSFSLSSSSSRNDDQDLPLPQDDDDDDCNSLDNTFHQELARRSEEIQIEQARTALEHQNTQSFLKRKPRKLPYEQARKWVQYNLGADTKEEFEDLVQNGNVRTPYIPKRPQEYYTLTREWISWEHFLTGYHKNQHPSAIKPSDGILD